MIFARALERNKSPKNAPLKWSNWYLTALKLAVVLLLVLLIALFWLLRQNDADEQRSTLIADVLWLEQSVNFHLEGNAEQIGQLANDLANEHNKHALFELRSQNLLKNNPDLQQIVWVDDTAQVVESTPSQRLPRLGYATPPSAAQEEIQARSIEMASKLGKTVYTDAYRVAGAAQFEIYSPIYKNGEYRGALIGVYAFDSLLKQLVPWWFAEKYQVRVLDGYGATLASKSKVSDVATTVSYAIPFDPPGYGMVLQVAAYRASGNLAQTLITTLIVALASAMLLSLWITRGHIKRRLIAEQALRAEHAFRKAMEDSLTVGMRARDMDGVITYVNPAFCQMVGFSAAELVGSRPPMRYWAPEDREVANSFYQDVLAGRAPREGVELRFVRKNGSRFDVLIYEAALIDADGQQTGWMASIVDVTERKRVEELTRQQQEKLQLTSRLVTMGEMASTLAHELNQPLAAITSYNTGCLNKLESGHFTGDELKLALGKLGVQAQRAGRIIRRVHEFVRKSEPKLAYCDLAEVIDDSVALIDAFSRLSNMRIVREIQGKRPELMADRVMIEQVLLNLMRNGIEAMGETPVERRFLTIALKQVDDQMELRVADCGSGMSAEVKEKLFSPFFSTKADGMGMGLNICRSIIEFHHGRLWVEDNPGGGSVFIITLPIELP